MRTLSEELLYRSVYHGIRVSSYSIPGDISKMLKNSVLEQKEEADKDIYKKPLIKAKDSKKNFTPLLKDTGHFNIFIGWGDKVCFNGISAEATIQKAVKDASKDLFLKPSTVIDPLFRKNIGDNLPAVIHWNVVEGEMIKITVIPRMARSENLSLIKMLPEDSTKEQITDYVVKTIKTMKKEENSLIFAGIGIGGNSETSLMEAKKAMVSPEPNSGPLYMEMEDEIKEKCNAGNKGNGSPDFIVMRIRINTVPCHINSMPVAITINQNFNQYWTSEI
ncbi:fumarate hydratase [bacterium]|nr:fumarate hydratase [bacterium]